jgi:universal stress protein E
MSDTVLAIIELDRFPEAVTSRAARIARRFSCDLELVLSDPTLAVLHDSFIVSNEAKLIADNIKTAQRQILEDLAEPESGSGVNITTTILDDSPASDAIVARALEVEPRFVVKGTEHHSPAERARFTYTDWRLIRKLVFPLWLVKPKEWKNKPVIVAAVDPTHQGDKEGTLDQIIVEAGKELATKCNGSLELLHTYERLVEIGRHAMFAFKPVKLPIDELEQNIRKMHREKLDALAASNNIPGRAVHQLPGRAHEILPMFARTHGADLVIMGAVARSGPKSRVLGGTAAKVLDHLPCDILIEQRVRN